MAHSPTGLRLLHQIAVAMRFAESFLADACCFLLPGPGGRETELWRFPHVRICNGFYCSMFCVT